MHNLGVGWQGLLSKLKEVSKSISMLLMYYLPSYSRQLIETCESLPKASLIALTISPYLYDKESLGTIPREDKALIKLY